MTTATDYTADEILAAFKAHHTGSDNTFDEDDLWYGGPRDKTIKENEDGSVARDENGGLIWVDTPFHLRGVPTKVTVVDRTGGADAGSNASITFKVGSQFFRKEGYYASHYGYEWDGDFREVKAVEKTVVVYE